MMTVLVTLAACCAFRLSWERAESDEFPYAVRVMGQTWRVRVNDFPAEAFYTLFIDGQAVGDFDDWPPAWARP